MLFDRAHPLHEVIDLIGEPRRIARSLFERFDTLAYVADSGCIRYALLRSF
jgi:hypothetical protein